MRIAAACLLISLQLTLPVRAESTDDEIAYLLQAIRQSPCIFIRNGSDYGGIAAAEHVQAKYEHFKHEIRTAEDFIARAATKSLLTGEPYMVRCEHEPTIAAAEWLHAVLGAYRARNEKPPTNPQ